MEALHIRATHILPVVANVVGEGVVVCAAISNIQAQVRQMHRIGASRFSGAVALARCPHTSSHVTSPLHPIHFTNVTCRRGIYEEQMAVLPSAIPYRCTSKHRDRNKFTLRFNRLQNTKATCASYIIHIAKHCFARRGASLLRIVSTFSLAAPQFCSLVNLCKS